MPVFIDTLIGEFDKGLRTLFGAYTASRPRPSGPAQAVDADDGAPATLSEPERRHSAALMRVNHCGEVCAQALYQGQAMASGNARIKHALDRAAREEQDHLAWSKERIEELGGRTSLLNPVWYAGSLALGFAAGKLGDSWNLGFVAETERQVERHLQGHLDRISPADADTRAIIEAMKTDEAGHAQLARDLGAAELPQPVKCGMAATARVMTSVSYWV
ncbi:MAG: 2-polyprenyl-3-methyl-6-methoxy-1,4-benzoquinone monooxygenase [Betaproteobacteria bacterium]|nr:2-polyprenyl-3-methyl-6-methoxy-1,4-benzoquinone monooxygenase [Betaproteobacteria bacterium]